MCFFFFKQKAAYELRISDWSSDVCSSDLRRQGGAEDSRPAPHVPAQATDHLMHQLHFFPSRTMALYVGRLFLVRSFSILFALVLILQTLDLLGEIGRAHV